MATPELRVIQPAMFSKYNGNDLYYLHILDQQQQGIDELKEWSSRPYCKYLIIFVNAGVGGLLCFVFP